jgi:hypothetical protein
MCPAHDRVLHRPRQAHPVDFVRAAGHSGNLLRLDAERAAATRRDGAMDMIVAPGEFEALGV